MNYSKLALLSSAGILAVAAACSSAPNSVKTTTESTTRTAGGSVKTTSETKEVGTVSVVGTVTVYTAGKRIEVMTGEKKMHSFSLDDRDITYSVDGYVAVGERVTVTDAWGDDKVHRITVKLGG